MKLENLNCTSKDLSEKGGYLETLSIYLKISVLIYKSHLKNGKKLSLEDQRLFQKNKSRLAKLEAIKNG